MLYKKPTKIQNRQIDNKFRVKICSLLVDFQNPIKEEQFLTKIREHDSFSIADIYILISLWWRNNLICNPMRTTYKKFDSKPIEWNEVLEFPVSYSDIPSDCLITFDLYNPCSNDYHHIGKCQQLFLWDDDGRMRRGDFYLKLSSDAMVTERKDQVNASKTPLLEWLLDKSLKAIEIEEMKYRRLQNCAFLKIRFPDFYLNNQLISLVYSSENIENVITTNLIKNDDYFICVDGESISDNLIEAMHTKLARNRFYKNNRPTASQRERLLKIIELPPRHLLSRDDLNLLWNNRYFLSTYPKALSKFLLSVQWEDELKEATKLMNMWAKLRIDDCIVLLGSDYNEIVHDFAIKSIESSDSIQFYIPQLVQALRYQDVNLKTTPKNKSLADNVNLTPLSQFLIKKAGTDLSIATSFYWYCKVEFEWFCMFDRNSPMISLYRLLFAELFRTLRNQSNRYPYLPTGYIFKQLSNQRKLVEKLIELTTLLKREHGHSNKQELLQSILSDENNRLKFNFLNFKEHVVSPLNTNVTLIGIDATKCKVYQSAQCPCKIVFRTLDDDHCVIFKNGDDLRQDQLVMQVIKMIDDVLKQDKLDLRLTTYPVLSTSYNTGFVGYVESITLRSVKQNQQNIRNYLLSLSKTQTKIDSNLLDAFVKSCAGYCVITFILGVGDRHLDNILIRPTGQIFHIDFSFIFGRDPKPLPPAVKVNKDMVLAMDDKVNEFRRHCFTTFLHLRKHCRLLFNVLSLMLDSNMNNISSDPNRILTKLYDKFCFHLDDDAAVSFLQRMIDQSISALVPQLMDILHEIATSVR